jgi:ABC-2 type transport system permease protein
MKTIFRVAKTELRTLFYSPIAWFLMIVFFIQCGLKYIGTIKNIARTQELGGMEINLLKTLTSGIFGGNTGLFPAVIQVLYLYIPLLTMSLISRETGSGTIKLLYSSPVKVREIVLGKYLSMMAYSLLLAAIVGVYVISGILHIKHPETGMLMTSMLGFYLLLCAYSAIGLFMSTLTTYQVVAAIASFVMIGVLSYIGELWQRIAFVRELTYFLSISGRTQKMLGGLVTTKDLVYFIMIVFIFLGFSICRLKDGRESKPWTIKALRYAGVLAIAFLVGCLTSIPGFIGYYDATNTKSNTITPRVQQIVKDLGDDPMEVTVYANLVEPHYFLSNPDSYKQSQARWDNYLRFKDNIPLKTVSYYDSTLDFPIFQIYPGKSLKEIADQSAKKYDMELTDYLTPQQIRKMVDLRPESNRYVMQVKWKGERAWLRVFDDSQVWPSETEIAVVLRRLQKARIPKVGFITGELERDIDKFSERDYKLLTNHASSRHSMVNQGFDVQTIVLETEDIPADLSALVLADPRQELTAAARARLMQYINRGGNLLIAGEPGRQALINPLLKELGIQMMDGLLIGETQYEPPTLLMQDLDSSVDKLFKPLAGFVKDSTPVSMAGAAGLTWTDSSAFTVQPLLRTKPHIVWNRIKAYDPELMVVARVDPTASTQAEAHIRTATGRNKDLGVVTFSPGDGDVMGPITTAVSLIRKIDNKEQHIIVTSDADFLSTKEMGREGTANFVFSTGIFSWLTGGEFPILAARPPALDNRIKVTLKEAAVLRTFYIWIVPGILLVFGAVLLIRRKRK